MYSGLSSLLRVAVVVPRWMRYSRLSSLLTLAVVVLRDN
jgi:hypothetical protein